MSQAQPQTKTCPSCGQTIPATAILCAYCNASLPALPAIQSQVAYAQVPPPLYVYQSKSRSTAVLLEVVPFFMGLLGFGWLYAGQTTTGLLWLVGFVIWNTFAVVADLFTFGIFACVHLLANLGLVVISAVSLSNYTLQHPELFKA